MKASQKLGEKMYEQQAAAGAAAQPEAAQAASSGGGKAGDDNVVDAEFTEVKDKKQG
jgi:molecular chaperone DnaK